MHAISVSNLKTWLHESPTQLQWTKERLAEAAAKPCDNQRQSRVNEEPARETIKVIPRGVANLCTCAQIAKKNCFRAHQATQTTISTDYLSTDKRRIE